MRASSTNFLQGLLVLVAIVALGGCQPRYKHPEASVILISVDTLRADHLSVYGYGRPTSPHLAAFAEEAVVFERFFSNGGGTLPSHISMLTSLTPGVHAVLPGYSVLEAERVTLAETFQAAGYATAAFTDAGWMRAEFGFSHGFDDFDETGGHLITIMPKVRQWIDAHRGEKFFLFFHTYDVHSKSEKLPYECPPPFVNLYLDDIATDFDGCREGKCASELLASFNARIRAGVVSPAEVFSDEELDFVIALYDGCINYVDHELARFFDYLRRLELYDDALIVVTSDHGEEFLEHGLLLHEQGGYDELARIPLLIKLPGGAFGGTRISHLAAMIDVMPTILDVVDQALSEQAQGTSLMSAVTHGEAVRDSVYMAEIIRDDRWMYMHLPNGRRELYDVWADPQERLNVVATHDDVAGKLDRTMRELGKRDAVRRKNFLNAVKAQRQNLELSPERIDELKALGYLQ